MDVREAVAQAVFRMKFPEATGQLSSEKAGLRRSMHHSADAILAALKEAGYVVTGDKAFEWDEAGVSEIIVQDVPHYFGSYVAALPIYNMEDGTLIGVRFATRDIRGQQENRNASRTP